MTSEVITQISVGVFPFENLSEKKGFDHFVTGFVDDLITDLSRFNGLSIRNIDPQSSTSNCEYLVKGSFRTYAERVRINIQLIKTSDESIVFAGRHDEDFEELFELQDQVVQQIVNVLQLQINHHLTTTTHQKPQTKIAAYDYWLRGMEALKKGSVESDLEAREHFNKALAIDPRYARAYTGLSLSYFNEWSCQLWNRWEVSKTGAGEYAQKALALDDNEYEAHAVMGRVYLYDADYEQAEHCLRKSMHLNPNDADNLVYIASCFSFLGKSDEAVEIFERAMQLNPFRPDWYYSYAALVYLEAGDYEKSAALGGTIAADSFWVDFPAYLAAAYFHLGNQEQMQLNWQIYLNSFRTKIANNQEADQSDAIHWFMNVNPYREVTNLQPFWEFLLTENGLAEQDLSQKKEYPKPAENSFKQEGELWQVCYAGHSVTLRGSKGLKDIAELLQHQGKELHSTELMGASIVNHQGIPLMDDKAKKAYEKKLIELREELEEAEDMNNIALAAELNEEYDQLVNHLSSSLGLAGETRKTGSSVEKARAAVTLRIRSTIKKIEQVHEPLAKHLSHSIKTGTFCSYIPEEKVDWLV